MEVYGKRPIGEHEMEDFSFTCQPCEEEGKYTIATGRCRECEENMCKTCFGHHRKAKVCKDHVLIDSAQVTGAMAINNRTEDELEKCPHHLNELIKFYCPDHDRVGCGDCMILDHKMCQLDYIPKKAKEFKESQSFDEVLKDINDCDALKEECTFEISAKKKRSEEMHAKCITEAEAYRDELVEHVNKLTNKICGIAKDVHAKNIESIEKIEKKVAERSQEMSMISDMFEPIRNQPYKLFVKVKENKKMIEALKRELGELKKNINFVECKFQRNYQLDDAVKECRPFDFISSDVAEESAKSLVANLNLSAVKRQRLLEQTLRADNLDIDGDYLSFDKDVGSNGLFIANVAMTAGSYFEVTIITRGDFCDSVGIGIVPDDYRKHGFPGWSRSSAGYHSDDGKVYIEQAHGTSFGPPCGINDRMGCGIAAITSQSVEFFFTRNGNLVGRRTLQTGIVLYPAVALDTCGQKVKVMLKANIPKF